MARQPHVLVLMCDQMQAQRLGCIDPVAHSPFLDELADEGVRFSHMVSCHGQCVPSRAGFITGQYPHECGVVVNYGFHGHQNRLSTQHRTLGHRFQDAGYHTAYFGKCHFGIPLEGMGFETARDYDKVAVSDEDVERLGIEDVPKTLRRDYLAAQDAVDYLKSYEPDGRPLFFMFSTNLPHPPFFHDTRHASRFSPEDMTLAESFHAETFSGKPPFQEEHARDGRHGAFDEGPMREEMAQYYSMIAAMDEHMAAVAEQFKRLGLWDDTVVLFFADHGDMMGAHKMHVKGTLPYEELYRIPCLLKPAQGQVAPRSVVDDLVSSIQLAGTLTELAGVDSGGLEHGSLCDALGRDERPQREAVFFEHYSAYWGTHPFYAIHTRDMKFIRYFGEDDTKEMYDLSEDPHELTNVAGDPRYARVQSELGRRAEEWWKRTGGRDLAYYESDEFKANCHNGGVPAEGGGA